LYNIRTFLFPSDISRKGCGTYVEDVKRICLSRRFIIDDEKSRILEELNKLINQSRAKRDVYRVSQMVQFQRKFINDEYSLEDAKSFLSIFKEMYEQNSDPGGANPMV